MPNGTDPLQALRCDQRGRQRYRVHPSNPGGLTVHVLDYGCIIKNIIVPAKNGPVDVVLGHDTMADYESDFTSSGSTCCGAFVGRYANRIENAVFSVGGKTYQLEKNNGENHLHGTFPRKLYRVKSFGDTLLMEAESPDGEDGFPGNLKIAVRYTLTEDNAFRMDYRVSSDADTIVNLTNHSYFNLDGEGDVLNQKLRLYASNYLEGNNATCPTGKILPVANSPMDFTAGKLIGRDIDTGFSQTTWWAAATTTALSSTAPAAPARASVPGPPAIRLASV